MSKNRLRRTAQIIICKRFHYCRATQLVCNFMLCNHQKYSTFVTFDPTQSNSSKTAKSRPNPTRGSTQPMDNSDVATIMLKKVCWYVKPFCYGWRCRNQSAGRELTSRRLLQHDHRVVALLPLLILHQHHPVAMATLPQRLEHLPSVCDSCYHT